MLNLLVTFSKNKVRTITMKIVVSNLHYYFQVGTTNLMNRLSLNECPSSNLVESGESDSNQNETSDESVTENDEEICEDNQKRKKESTNKRKKFEESSIMDQTTILAKKFNKCEGFSTSFCENIYILFPFQAFQYQQLNFVFENGKLHALACCHNNYFCENEGKINKECFNLKFDNKLNKILERVENISKYTNHQYMSYTQMVDKVSKYVMKLDEIRLESLNKDYLLISYKNQISLYKRFNNLLATHDVERIKQLMTICIKNRMGIKGIINKFLMAVNNLYSPKQWNKNDIELGNLTF